MHRIFMPFGILPLNGGENLLKERRRVQRKVKKEREEKEVFECSTLEGPLTDALENCFSSYSLHLKLDLVLYLCFRLLRGAPDLKWFSH